MVNKKSSAKSMVRKIRMETEFILRRVTIFLVHAKLGSFHPIFFPDDFSKGKTV